MMKVTIDIPDELYRQLKAKSALEGRPVREVTEDLYRGFVGGPPAEVAEEEAPRGPGEEAAPEWFGALKQ